LPHDDTRDLPQPDLLISTKQKCLKPEQRRNLHR